MSSKFKNFNEDIKNLSKFEDKIYNLYLTEYYHLLELIVIKPKEEYLKTLSHNVACLLEHEYLPSIFQNSKLLALLRKYNSILTKDYYQKDITSILASIKINPHGEILNNSFTKHCIYQESELIHQCEEEETCNKFIKCEQRGIIICANCNFCYLTSCVKLYCNFCSLNFYSSFDNNNNNVNNNLQPATWEKYHCNIIFNDQMPCVQCEISKLFLDTKKNMLICLNDKCNFISEPLNILWKCLICSQEFKSNAKIYNPLEYKMVKRAIKDSLIEKKIAYPKNYPCECKNIGSMKHKEGCDGILYLGILNDRQMVICAKCNSMTPLDKFIWTCPKCNKRFRDNEGYNLNEIFSSIWMNSSIIKYEDYKSVNEINGNKTLIRDNSREICKSNNNKDINNNKNSINQKENIRLSKFNAKNKNEQLKEINIKDYDIISQISMGNRSKVFVVKEVDTMKFYAFKKYNFIYYPRDYIHFLKIQNSFALKNINIVKIKGFFYEAKSKELNVLEELAMSDLEKEIISLKRAKSYYSEQDILSLLSQIVNACAFLQRAGYAHWNIIPSNIYIFQQKIFKLSKLDKIQTIVNCKNGVKEENFFSDPSLMEKMHYKGIEDLVKYDVFSLGLCILYLITLDFQCVIDVQNYWKLKKNVDDFNENINYLLDKEIGKSLNNGDNIKEVIKNMLKFTLKKRFDFLQLEEHLLKLNINN